MTDLLPFIISGLAAGAIYGLAGTGLVLTYKTSGLFNFGYGAMATVSAYVFYWLHVTHQVDWKIAAFISVLVLGPVMGLLMEPLARALSVQPVIHKVVGTVGLIVCVQGLATIKYGVDNISVDQFLPKGTQTFRALGVNIGYDQLTIAVLSLLIVACLYWVFRRTRIGILMRAVVDDADLLDVQGTNPIRIRWVAWVAGSTLAALSGVLVVPIVGLDPIVLSFLVVQAFGAAAVGAFSSIPLTFAGGLLIGVAADICRKFVVSVGWLSGLPAGLPFLVLFFVLLALPKRKLAGNVTAERKLEVNYKGPPLARLTAGIVVLVPLALVPVFAGAKLGFFSMALSLMIVLLSLGLLVKTSGQVSLCHAAFMAIGACMFSNLAVVHHWPWFAALFVAALIVVPVGALIAIPAIRLSGLFLALATFGFGILVEQLFYPLNFMFGKINSGRNIPRPSFAKGDTGFYYLILVFVVLTGLIMIAIHEGRLGRLLRGLSDSPLAMGTFGLNTNVIKVIVFSVSTFFAALGGIFYGASFHFAASGDPRFMSLYSLVLLVILVIAPFREPWYVVPSAIGVAIPAFWTTTNSEYWLNAVTGVFAVITAVVGGAPVMPAGLRAKLDRVFTVGRGSGVTPALAGVPTSQLAAAANTNGATPAHAPTPANGTVHSSAPAYVTPSATVPAHGTPAAESSADAGLHVVGLTVRFGGLVAVDDLTMSAGINRITGLIGPNGAGKTTTFNSCSGLNRPSGGRILIHGEDVSSLSPAARAQRGLGRTFQRMELCDALSVSENVALGREAGQAGSRPLRHLIAPRSQHRVTQRATKEALELCGIANIASRRAGELSTGQRRLVELARCLAGSFDILALDEPSSGLDGQETEHFGELLRTVVRERGCGILLVEHDVGLVMRVCENIYVLDFGKLLFEGNPAAVAASSEVQAAYLGAPVSAEDPADADLIENFAGEVR
jgi:ABC-type branched-subunit amino acid transport system ATPase component/branched-subunit amino acid ABC-type transport system permease component